MFVKQGLTEGERRAVKFGMAIGAILAGCFYVGFAIGIDWWRQNNDAELRRQAAAAVELRLAEKKRELRICQTKLAGYQEIAALEQSLLEAAQRRAK